MRIKFRLKPFLFNVQLGNREYIDLVDHLLELMEHQPERFRVGKHRLIDTETKWEYWIATGSFNVRIQDPKEGERWGYWQGRRFLKGIKKYVKPQRKKEETTAWKEVYLKVEAEKKLEFAKVYHDHAKLREKHPGLEELYEKYLALYYLCGGKQK